MKMLVDWRSSTCVQMNIETHQVDPDVLRVMSPLAVKEKAE
jgi:hypothetical protein